MKLAFGALAALGAFIGWLCDRDAAFVTPARIVGRVGWGLMALALVALVALPGCADLSAAARYCLQHPDHCR